MEIDVRRIDKKYKSVKIENNYTIIDLGLFDEDECLTLAQHLESVADDLLSGWD